MDYTISVYLGLGLLLIWVLRLIFIPSKVSLFYNDNINKLQIIERHINNKKNSKSTERDNVPSLKWLDFLLSKSPSLSGKRQFYPTPYLGNGHLQTFYTSYAAAKGTRFKYDRETFPLSDGGQVSLDWYPERPNNQDLHIPIVVILHGLTGNSQEGYCRATVKRLTNKGKFRTVVFNFRGCGETEVLVPYIYNAGDTGDFKEVIAYIHNLVPVTKKFAVGFSLGSNLLVKYLGEEGEKSLFSGAISISNPSDLTDFTNMFLTQTLPRNVYDPILVTGPKQLLAKHPLLKGHYNERNWRSVRSFDRDVIRKMGDFQTVNDYYRWASSDQFVTRVRVPLLLLNAEDDFVSPEMAIPYQECKHNPYVLLATTKTGGHIGWWEGFTPRHWFPSLINEYFSALDEVLEQTVSSQFFNQS